jgi:hypothetical protein
MASNRASAKALGLTEKEMTVLLYGILCPSPDGSRVSLFNHTIISICLSLISLTIHQSLVDYEKLARELGYTYSSIKVVYGNARRKLVRETGITPATRGSEPAISDVPDTSAGLAVDLGGSASATADEEEKGETSKPRKARRGPRKRKASEMDEEA